MQLSRIWFYSEKRRTYWKKYHSGNYLLHKGNRLRWNNMNGVNFQGDFYTILKEVKQTMRDGSNQGKDTVVMVRTLGNFLRQKRTGEKFWQKKDRWEFWGRFSCGWEPKLPGFTRAPTGFNRCLAEVSSHHGRGKKNEMKKSDFVRIAVLCDQQLVLMQCWVRMRQSSNQLWWDHSNPCLQPAQGIITPSASSQNTITDPQRIIMLPFPLREYLQFVDILSFYGNMGYRDFMFIFHIHKLFPSQVLGQL